MKLNSIYKRRRIRDRIRKKIKGTGTRPRLCVFRSNKAIYCQIIDDLKGITLVAASSRDAGMESGTKSAQSKAVGKALAERAMAANIKSVVFDRSGYLYHGRVKELAEGAREGGLDF